MKVCLVNPPWEDEHRWGIRSGCRFPNLMPRKHNSYVPFPFLLAYTAAVLESNGIDVLVIDGIAERCSTKEFLHRIEQYSPQLLIAETATTSFNHDLLLLSPLVKNVPGLQLVFYGPHVSVLPEETLRSESVFAVIVGEPEQTALALVRALEKGADPETVNGLVFRKKDGTLHHTPPRRLLENIDTLPYPKRSGMPMHAYHVPGFPDQVVFMYGSRGCPYRCNFCLWPQTLFGTGSYRSRPGESIAAEIAWVRENLPAVRSIFFDDDTFHLGRERMLNFADAMERRGLVIPWGCNGRADNWDAEILTRLKNSGLFTLRIGIESGDQGVLDRTGKSLNLAAATTTLALIQKMGIQIHLSFVIGLDGESQNSLDNTLRFIRSNPVASVQFSVAVPFPGTSYYRYVEDHDFFVTRDWTHFNGFDHVVMRTEYLSAEEIMHGIQTLRRRVYFSPKFIAKRLRYVRNFRDLGALTRKVIRLVRG